MKAVIRWCYLYAEWVSWPVASRLQIRRCVNSVALIYVFSNVMHMAAECLQMQTMHISVGKAFARKLTAHVCPVPVCVKSVTAFWQSPLTGCQTFSRTSTLGVFYPIDSSKGDNKVHFSASTFAQVHTYSRMCCWRYETLFQHTILSPQVYVQPLSLFAPNLGQYRYNQR